MRTVLVTDDSAETRTFIRYILEALGYRVLEAETAHEAVSISDDFDGPIDLLVMDVVLPDSFGPAAAIRIRERRPETKAIYISGYETLPILEEQVGKGEGFIQKPFVRSAFASKVRDVLEAA